MNINCADVVIANGPMEDGLHRGLLGCRWLSGVDLASELIGLCP
jgi:hypothetical protein